MHRGEGTYNRVRSGSDPLCVRVQYPEKPNSESDSTPDACPEGNKQGIWNGISVAQKLENKYLVAGVLISLTFFILAVVIFSESKQTTGIYSNILSMLFLELLLACFIILVVMIMSHMTGNIFGIHSFSRLLLVCAIILICSNELILPFFGSFVLSFMAYTWYMSKTNREEEVPVIGQLRLYIDRITTERVQAIAREMAKKELTEAKNEFQGQFSQGQFSQEDAEMLRRFVDKRDSNGARKSNSSGQDLRYRRNSAGDRSSDYEDEQTRPIPTTLPLPPPNEGRRRRDDRHGYAMNSRRSRSVPPTQTTDMRNYSRERKSGGSLL